MGPVYYGKTLYQFLTKVLDEDSEAYRNANILFWYTGGAFGIYDKEGDLAERLQSVSTVKRIDIYWTKSGKANAKGEAEVVQSLEKVRSFLLDLKAQL